MADDHALVRQGMVEMLSTDEKIEVVGEAENGKEAVAFVRQRVPDVVILDVEMPVMGAQPALRRMLETSPPPKVIIVTVFADQRLVRELLRLGASAFLTKNTSMRDLIATVHSVARGKAEDNVTFSVPRDSLGSVRDAKGTPGATEDEGVELSAQEKEILLALARGMSNKQTGQRLHLSETTVKRHLTNIYAKLGVSSRNGAIRRALSEGWISSWEASKDA